MRWDLEEKTNTNLLWCKDRRSAPRRYVDPPSAGRSFDEELSLFERQARDEAERRTREAASPAREPRTAS